MLYPGEDFHDNGILCVKRFISVNNKAQTKVIPSFLSNAGRVWVLPTIKPFKMDCSGKFGISTLNSIKCTVLIQRVLGIKISKTN